MTARPLWDKRGLRRAALMLVALSLLAGCGGSRQQKAKATPTATIGKLVPGTRPVGTAAFL